MIEVRELTKAYADLHRGQFVALDGLSFTAGRGEIYGLLGPNGAGKTTALRILSTVLAPTSGTAIVNGFDVVTQPAQVRHTIGFMSTNGFANAWSCCSTASRCKRFAICSAPRCRRA
jgi:sodium transport system ATP-binding protein